MYNIQGLSCDKSIVIGCARQHEADTDGRKLEINPMSIRTILFALLTVTIWTNYAQGVEPKVLHLDDGTALEYVEVRDEPRHRHRFENERIRLYDVLIPPKDTSLFHRHSRNTVYLVVQATTLNTQLPGAAPFAARIKQSAVTYTPQATTPVIHAVGNIGEQDARLIGVEMKEPEKPFSRSPLEIDHLTLDQTFPGLRVYRVRLAPGGSTSQIKGNFDGVLISITKATIATDATGSESSSSLEPADWRWLTASNTFTIRNATPNELEAVLYELP